MAAASRDDIARVSGPDSMAAPPRNESSNATATASAPPGAAPALAGPPVAAKKKRHRAGRKRKNKRQSFIAPSEGTEEPGDLDDRPSRLDNPRGSVQHSSFYRLQSAMRSNTSLESEALLDHRDTGPLSRRRQSNQQGFGRSVAHNHRHSHRPSEIPAHSKSLAQTPRSGHAPAVFISDDDDDDAPTTDRTPLLPHGRTKSKPEIARTNSGMNYGSHGSHWGTRRASTHSKGSSRRPGTAHNHAEEEHDVNNPPSMPGTPTMGALDDVFVSDGLDDRGRDAVIDIDGPGLLDRRYSSSSPETTRRRPTVYDLAERDVCFPGDVGMSEIGEEDEEHDRHATSQSRRRRRGRLWPDLDILEQWSRDEKEARTQQDMLRAKKISEPLLVNGRLRAQRAAWHKEEENAPFRFTYFNEMLDGTIHSTSISDLAQDGMTFREMFVPDPIEITDSSDDEEEHEENNDDDGSVKPPRSQAENGALDRTPTLDRTSTRPTSPFEKRGAMSPPASISHRLDLKTESKPGSGRATPTPKTTGRRKRYADPPSFWLDVLNPTPAEVMILGKAFGIHQLTVEDINEQESREKVELFQRYYFVNYRTFEQDTNSEDYMEPINVYVVVFREGVISFHHSQCPHPANVRRRIRQLGDYLSPSADWISYGIIDNITDAYGPLVNQIEEEVDEIDEEILYMHTTFADKAVPATAKTKDPRPKGQDAKVEDKTGGGAGGDMLRRVGECRKKVMSLYRLLGNKADVIKGFAKRCNESWDVAPRSEIGLYLGDIQDHIVTMTANLSHCEELLSRAHGNYVAQINIRMNERAEQNADVLGKLTVLGTIVLPMNIITGMWGMNVWVPGQEYEGDLTWFFGITAGLIMFGLTSYFIAKKVYGIV